MKRKHGASRLLFLSSLLPLFPHRTLLSACVLCVLVCLYLPLAFCDLTYLRQYRDCRSTHGYCAVPAGVTILLASRRLLFSFKSNCCSSSRAVWAFPCSKIQRNSSVKSSARKTAKDCNIYLCQGSQSPMDLRFLL